MHDFRNAPRALRATPVITLMAILSLALGIGANTAIFSLIDSLLLRSLPVKVPQRLVMLDKGSWTNPIWEQIRDRQMQVFEGAAAWSSARFDLARGGQAEFVEGLWVSGGFFEVPIPSAGKSDRWDGPALCGLPRKLSGWWKTRYIVPCANL